MSSLLKNKLVTLAHHEGILCLSGNEYKAGYKIEKYLSVFRETLGRSNPHYLSSKQGYDWCCAYVYYLLKKAGYTLNITPLPNSDKTLASVRTWYEWALHENIFISKHYPAKAGDLILFDRLIERVELDHIGIVIKNDKNSVITSEGNYYNATGIFTRKKDATIKGYIRLK